MINTKNFEVLREEKLSGKKQGDFVSIASLKEAIIYIKKDKDNEKIYIERVAQRSKIKNLLDQYEKVDNDGNVKLLPLTLEIANDILNKLISGCEWSDAFLISENNEEREEMVWQKTESEHKFTSTGIKFWRHKDKLEGYRSNNGRSIISTHISPEGSCNLKCPYCSVSYRDTHSRIKLDRIKDYVLQLKSRGLKAVITSGGGEPTLYKEFNEYISWLKFDQGLSLGLITNGTQFNKFDNDIWKAFDWIRVSINIFDGWEDKIGSNFKKELMHPDSVLGCSMVYTVEHESTKEKNIDRADLFKRVAKVADKLDAKYIRILPNCLLEQKNLILEHQNLKKFLEENVKDERFFQQYKVHKAPDSSVCHQGYFRPYLSEEPWHEDGEPGTVYPCDSVVLNDSVAHFGQQYQICKLEDVGKFMDGEIQMKFDPRKACSGCVFTENVNLLNKWKECGENRFEEFNQPIKHEEFV